MSMSNAAAVPTVEVSSVDRATIGETAGAEAVISGEAGTLTAPSSADCSRTMISKLFLRFMILSDPLLYQLSSSCLRRRQITEALAQAIGIHYVKKDHVVRKTLAKNVKPYILLSGHLFEEYRSGLANRVNGPLCRASNSMLADRLEVQILSTYYNRETVQRICLTYTMINRILPQRFS